MNAHSYPDLLYLTFTVTLKNWHFPENEENLFVLYNYLEFQLLSKSKTLDNVRSLCKFKSGMF